MKWLQEEKGHISKLLIVKHDQNVEISSLKEETALRPENNCVMKWEEGTDEIYCFRNKKNKSSSPDIDFGRKYGDRRGNNGSERRSKDIRKGHKIFGRKEIVWLSVAVIVLVFAGGFFVNDYLLNKAAYAQTQDTLKIVTQQLEQKKKEIEKIGEEIKNYESEFHTALNNAMTNGFSEKFDAFADRAKEANRKGLEAKDKLEQARRDKNNLEAKKNDLFQEVNERKVSRDVIKVKTATISGDVQILDASVKNAQEATEDLEDAVKYLGNPSTNTSSHSAEIK